MSFLLADKNRAYRDISCLDRQIQRLPLKHCNGEQERTAPSIRGGDIGHSKNSRKKYLVVNISGTIAVRFHLAKGRTVPRTGKESGNIPEVRCIELVAWTEMFGRHMARAKMKRRVREKVSSRTGSLRSWQCHARM